MGRSRKQKRRKAKQYDRKNWTPSDPCMKCGDHGPHVVEFSHTVSHGEYAGNHYKCSCHHCGTYQKFLSERQAMPYVKGKPVWQESVNAPF